MTIMLKEDFYKQTLLRGFQEVFFEAPFCYCGILHA